jgi:hypothetical protein
MLKVSVYYRYSGEEKSYFIRMLMFGQIVSSGAFADLHDCFHWLNNAIGSSNYELVDVNTLERLRKEEPCNRITQF